MSHGMLVFLDLAFFVFHALLILFNLVGWAWRRTRLLHLLTFGATIISWFVLGAFYGWGYCVCTDWHFEVREELGYQDPEVSYIQLLARQLLGVSLSIAAADWIAGSVFGFIVLATATTWTLILWRRFRAVPDPVPSTQEGK